MNKKVPLFLVIIVFLLRFNFVFADVSINEISYDLDGGDIDFVEVVNNGSDVDLTSLKLFIDNSTSNHSINNSSGASVLHNGEYGVIVQSSAITNYTDKFGTAGNIFTSSFSLPNDAGQIQINAGDKNSPISSVSYTSSQGASGDGNSLQKINGSWVSATPTPGQINSSSNNTTNNSSNNNINNTSSDNSSGTTFTPSEKAKVIEYKIKTHISAQNNGFVGIPITFSANTTGHKNEALLYGKYYWNFGDGDSKEIYLNQAQKFTHTYFYPGEYNVSLEFYDNYYAENPEAIDSMIIKIVSNDVVISSVGNNQDFFIELYNSSSYDVDISKWSLQSNNKTFIFPKNTILQSKSKMKISSKITNFTIDDSNNLRLISSTSENVFTYGMSKQIRTNNIAYKNPSTKIIPNKTENIKDLSNTINSNDLTSSVVNTQIKNNSKNLILIIMFFVLILIIAILAVYFLRKKINPIENSESNDFEILAE